MENKKDTSGVAIASLVIGIISLLLSCCYGGFLGVIGIILSIIGINNSNKKAVPVCGLITSIISFVITIFCLIFGFALLDEMSKEEPITTSESKPITNTDDSSNSNDSDTFTYGNSTIKYLSHEIVKDGDEDVLVVYYEFTNNEDKPYEFDLFVTGKAYQNGVELKSSWTYTNDECKNASKEIQTGNTVKVANSYPLSESRDEVTIEFRPFNVWSDKLLWSTNLKLE